MTTQERINQRFAKDFNLPINIFGEEMFEYYMRLYEFWPDREWEALLDEIDGQYNGNMDAWLEHYAKTRDKIICDIENSEAYKNFNACDMKMYEISDAHIRNLPDRNIYNEECEGTIYVSLDLRKANFQALKYAKVISEDTYEEFIDKYDSSFYFKKSKYTRQVIFGKLNPKRTITVERYLMGEIAKNYFQAIEDEYGELIAFKSDELIWKVDGVVSADDLKEIEATVKRDFGLDVKAECFMVKRLPVVNANGNKVSAYVRKDMNTNEEVLKAASTTYYPQIYKLWKGWNICDKDLMFFHEDQMATFIEPLRLESK